MIMKIWRVYNYKSPKFILNSSFNSIPIIMRRIAILLSKGIPGRLGLRFKDRVPRRCSLASGFYDRILKPASLILKIGYRLISESRSRLLDMFCYVVGVVSSGLSHHGFWALSWLFGNRLIS